MRNNKQNVNITKLTTKQFVDYVNKHHRINFKNEVKNHLERTLKENCKYTNYLELTGFPDNNLMLANITNAKDLELFLNFKNPIYKKIASAYFIENLNTNVLEDFYDHTTPHCYHGPDWATDNFPINKNYEFIYGAYKMLLKNPDIFSKENVKSFIDSYIDTLYKRTNHPRTNFEPYWIKSSMVKGAMQLVKPNYHYTSMKGMYFLDTKLLLEMTKFLKENNLTLTKVAQVIKELPFQETGYTSISKEQESFEKSVDEIQSILKNPKIFENNKKLTKKKKIPFNTLNKYKVEKEFFEL